jgi:hypothetical protein
MFNFADYQPQGTSPQFPPTSDPDGYNLGDELTSKNDHSVSVARQGE